MLKRKPLTINGTAAGDAVTWEEIAAIIGKTAGRPYSVRELQLFSSEGPDGFYVTLRGASDAPAWAAPSERPEIPASLSPSA
ncbi:MAG TPA: hypothetical protein VET85_13590 [Stellaceae bacterium]|nr:hypothetical protein [Stellaceae bacterium]